MFKILCVNCGIYLKPKKNGVHVIKEEEYIYRADLYQCPNCGFEIIGDFGDKPVAEFYNKERWSAYRNSNSYNYLVY